MIQPASRLVFRFALTVAVAAMVMLGVLAIRIMVGPVSLRVATPFLEAEINKALSVHRIQIGDTVLRWSRGEGSVDLRFVDVHLADLEGTPIASVPEMEVSFSAAALGQGLVAPSRVEVFGPSATLIRRRDGGVQLGFSVPGQGAMKEGSNAFFTGLVAALTTQPRRTDRLGFLEEFLIRDATLTYYDGPTDSEWVAPGSVLSLRRGPAGLVARLSGQVGDNGENFHVDGEATLDRGSNRVHISVNLDHLRPSALAAKSVAFRDLAGIDLPVRGDATMVVTTEGRILRSNFWLFADAGHFTMPGLGAVALDVTMAEIKGIYEQGADRLVLDRLTYDAGRNRGYFSGTATLDRNAQGYVAGVKLDLVADAIAIDLPGIFSEPGMIEKLGLRADVDFENRHVTLHDAILQTGSATIALSGTVDDAPRSPAMALTGTIEALPLADFAKLWPIGPARGARDWIVDNISKGVIVDGLFKLDAAAGVLAEDRLSDEVLDLTFAYEGLETSYIRGLTPISGARGKARLTGNRFDLWLTDGAIGRLSVSEGHFAVSDLVQHGTPADIDVRLTGPADALLGVLDMPPLGYPSGFGIDPATIGGTADGRLKVRVPLLRAARFADINLDAAVSVTGFKMPELYRDFAIDDGSVRFVVTTEHLVADGDVTMGGYPAVIHWTEEFDQTSGTSTHLVLDTTLDEKGRARAAVPLDAYFSGPTPVRATIKGRGADVDTVALAVDLGPSATRLPELGFSKPVGVAGWLKLTLDLREPGRLAFEDIEASSDGLDVRGRVVLDENGAIETVEIDPLRAAPGTDAVIALTRDKAGNLTVSARGAGLDIGGGVAALREQFAASDRSGADVDETDIALSARLGRLALANGAVLNDFSANYETREGALVEFDIHGAPATGGRLDATLSRDADGRRLVRFDTDDAGSVLSGLDLNAQVVGGRAQFAMVMPPVDGNQGAGAVTAPPVGAQASEGTLELRDFRVIKAPVLAKLLTVGSLVGARDLLSGEGIAFEALSAPFTLTENGLVLGASRAYGPAVGLTMEGIVPLGDGDYNLSGTLVPAYTLNTFLGYVPMLGGLLVSREGEGLIGLTYSIDGAAADPQVAVNPLSAFAPGFLRRIFQIGDASDAQKSPNAPPVTRE